MQVAPSSVHRCVVVIVGVLTALATLLVISGVTSVPASAAPSAPAAAQCDPPAFPTGAGFGVNCTLAIDNMVSSAGVVSSTVTATACLAAAGVLPPFGCTTTVTSSNQLVTSANQCNDIVYGGGSNVTCSVSVVNTIPTGTVSAGATVNQCIGSGDGGGTQPTVVCAPVASTTNATVTQCNGSANGGGASTRVQCHVTGASTAEPVTINQCNGSSNGGGSTVTCVTTFTNNFIASATSTAPTSPSGTGGTTKTGGTTGSTPAPGSAHPTPVGAGVTGKSGSASPVGGSTGTLGLVPSGSPQTGFGGAARSARDNDLVIPSAVALFGAAIAIFFATRRRQNNPHQAK